MNFEAMLTRRFEREEINGDGLCPTYLFRWTIFRIGPYALYLHKFIGDDWAIDPHDHPKRFVSLGLRGGYTEWTPLKKGSPDGTTEEWRAPWLRTFPATHVHRLMGPTPENPCWTLVLTLKTVRPWGFWMRDVFVPWRKYVNSPDAASRKSCTE